MLPGSGLTALVLSLEAPIYLLDLVLHVLAYNSTYIVRASIILATLGQHTAPGPFQRRVSFMLALPLLTARSYCEYIWMPNYHRIAKLCITYNEEIR